MNREPTPPPAYLAPNDAGLEAIADREYWRVRGGDGAFLNNASTGPLPNVALQAIGEFNALRAEPWRISQEYQFGILDRSRELLAQMVGASAQEIALMINTTYGLNFAARALPFEPGDVVLTSDREYPTNIYPWMELERARGIQLQRLPCAGRLADEDALIAALDAPRVRAVVHSWVSFETGLRLDLARVGRACRERGIWFIVDAIQGVGAVPLDLRNLDVDILACGAQKWLLSPWGTGFVYVRRALISQLTPVDVGWMSVRRSDDFTRMLDYDFTYRDDARRFEVITLPFQDFVGLNASLDVFGEVGHSTVYQRVAANSAYLIDRTLAEPSLTLLTPADPARHAGTVSVIPRDPAAASERLTGRGIRHSLREGAIRLSPHWYTPRSHLDLAIETVVRG